MSGFDLPSLPGLDLAQLQRTPLRELLPKVTGPQDPERVRLPDASRGGSGGQAPFEGVLADSLSKVQALQDDVRQKTRGLALGEDVELHDVLIATGKSEVAFNLLLEVRNKLVDAWEKLSRSAV